MIDAKTSLFGVFGNPISHSLSPAMHNHAFTHINYPAIYLAFNIEDIQAAVAAMRTLNIKGASVTIPHKETVMDHLDEIDETARKIGAVNTIVNENGKLKGTNTDWLGAILSIEEITSIRGKRAAVIGAGGAARAIVYGLFQRGADILIYNRSEKKGERLAHEMGGKFYPLTSFGEHVLDIVINTTSVGMVPDISAIPVESASLNSSMLVMDIVYHPIKTQLLKAAEQLGCHTIDGVSMFVRQGASQFELWTKEKAPVEIMKRVVMKALT